MAGRDDHYILPELFTDEEWADFASALGMTPRQAEVARLICRGLSGEGIAKRLAISPNTSRMHISAIFKKLKVHERIGVVVKLVLLHRRLAKHE